MNSDIVKTMIEDIGRSGDVLNIGTKTLTYEFDVQVMEQTINAIIYPDSGIQDAINAIVWKIKT